MNTDFLKKFVIVLIFINFILISFHRLNKRNNSEVLDQGAYLKLGLMIKDRKAMTDANRNPLYPFILSFFAERNTEYFITGKLLTLVIGFIVLFIIFLYISKIWDVFTASAVLVLITPAFIEMSSGIICEALVTLWFFLTWIYIARGFENYKYWIFAGIFTGLCILTKGTGNVLLITFLITLLIIYGAKWKKILRSWGYFLSYTLIAMPLIIYNLNKFGEPFFNVNTKYFMWLDKWEDYFKIKTSLPTFGKYFETHNFADILIRELKGLYKAPGAVILTIFLILFGILPFFKLKYFDKYRNNRAVVIFSVSIVLIHFLLFAWLVPIGRGTRFVFPLYPMIFTLTIDFVLFYYRDAIGSIIKKYLNIIAVVLAAGVLGETLFLNLNNPYKNEIYTYPQVEKWLNETERQHEKILYGPGDALPEWKISDKIEFVSVPSDVNINELEDYIKQNKINYFILDQDILFRRIQLLSSIAVYNQKEGIILKNIPKTWNIIMEDDKKPKKYYVIKFV